MGGDRCNRSASLKTQDSPENWREIGSQVNSSRSRPLKLSMKALERLARCDVAPFHLGPIRPLQDRVAGRLATIVADDHLRLASSLDDPVQFTGNPHTGKRRIRDESQTLPGAIVDHRKHPESATIGELIRHEVQ